jgi:hypothetical protein
MKCLMKMRSSKNYLCLLFLYNFVKFRYHFDALAEANDAQNVQDHIVDRIEPIPINSLIVQR